MCPAAEPLPLLCAASILGEVQVLSVPTSHLASGAQPGERKGDGGPDENGLLPAGSLLRASMRVQVRLPVPTCLGHPCYERMGACI